MKFRFLTLTPIHQDVIVIHAEDIRRDIHGFQMGSVKIETEMEKRDDDGKTAELSNLCGQRKKYSFEKYIQKTKSRRKFEKYFPFYIGRKKYLLY